MRDLVRAREDAVNDQRRVRQRLKSFLLRHGHSYTGTRWGPKHELFLSKIKFEDSAQHIVFTEYRMAVRFATELVERLTQSLRTHAETWRWLPMVKGLMTLRSIDFISALTIVAELGDSNCCASSASVRSPLTAASAIFALNAAECVRRVLFVHFPGSFALHYRWLRPRPIHLSGYSILRGYLCRRFDQIPYIYTL